MKLLFPGTILYAAANVLATSQIALFTDTNCQETLRGLQGPNGYPNGTCTDLRRNGAYGSFQVVGLDAGCTVTIYMEDTTVDICSGYQEEIRPIDCYNSTFVYYSIDFCDAGAISVSPSSIPTSPPGSPGLSTGAIAGAAIGGVVGVGIIIGLVAFFVMRRRKQARNKPVVVNENVGVVPIEIQAKDLQELGPGAVKYKREEAFEVEHPPVELEGMERSRGQG